MRCCCRPEHLELVYILGRAYTIFKMVPWYKNPEYGLAGTSKTKCIVHDSFLNLKVAEKYLYNL